MDIWKVTAGHTVIFNTPKQEEKVYVEVADLLDFGSLYPGQILYPKQKNKVKNLPSKGLHRFEFVAGRNELGNVHIHRLADLDENRFDSLIRFAWMKSRLFARKALPGAWIDMILQSTSKLDLALQSIGYVVCGEYGINPRISKSEKEAISKLLISSGINRRTAITNIGRKRIQLDLEGGVLKYLER